MEHGHKEAASNSESTTNNQTPHFRNPTDIPDYYAIDVIEAVQVHSNPSNDSVVSTDEFVPAVEDADGHPPPLLNCQVPTNHLS